MDVDIQECFGALLQKYGDAVLKEEPGKTPYEKPKPPNSRGARQWAPARRSITSYAASAGSTAERQSPLTGPHTGSESIGQIGTPTENLHQGTEKRYDMDHFPSTWPHELTFASVSSRATAEAEPAKGSRRAATEECAHNVPARASAQAVGQLAGASAQRREMAVPDMESILGSPGCGRKGPTTEQRCGGNVVQGDPLLGEPLHGQPFPCEWWAQGDEQQGGSLSVADLQQDSRLPGCQDVWQVLEKTQGPLSAPIDWHPDEARLAPTITSRGCSSEALLRICQLKLLNSNNTCYLNAFVLSWLHAITRTGCTEHAAFGCRAQAWRDVLYSGKAIHVHALPSWQGILEGWTEVHRQHDAGEMLEHWVAAGRLQVVSGRWEARIAERGLVQIRHYAESSSPINVFMNLSRLLICSSSSWNGM